MIVTSFLDSHLSHYKMDLHSICTYLPFRPHTRYRTNATSYLILANLDICLFVLEILAITAFTDHCFYFRHRNFCTNEPSLKMMDLIYESLPNGKFRERTGKTTHTANQQIQQVLFSNVHGVLYSRVITSDRPRCCTTALWLSNSHTKLWRHHV